MDFDAQFHFHKKKITHHCESCAGLTLASGLHVLVKKPRGTASGGGFLVRVSIFLDEGILEDKV